MGQLKTITEELQQTMSNTPEILVKPTYDKIVESKTTVLEMLADIQENPDVGTIPPQQEKLQETETEISELLTEFQMELQSQPWHNPPSLRKLRETTDMMHKKIADLRKQQ